MRWGRSIGDKCHLQVIDDPVHHAVVGEESDDLHLPTALGAEQGIDFIDFTDHLGPAFGRETPELLLHPPERKRPKACLPDLPPMSIGVQAEVTDSDLSLVGYMGSDPGDRWKVPQKTHRQRGGRKFSPGKGEMAR